MSSIVISGDTSGTVALAAPAIAGTNTMTLLAATGSLGPKVLTTSQATTSGTAIDFTGIPSWATRVTIMFNGVSTSASSNFLVQIGSGSIVSTGYLGSAIAIQTIAVSGTGVVNNTGFTVVSSIVAATALQYGTVTLNYIGSNVWVQQGVIADNTAARVTVSGGTLALAGALDRVRITSVTPDTFDAGSVNIMYE